MTWRSRSRCQETSAARQSESDSSDGIENVQHRNSPIGVDRVAGLLGVRPKEILIRDQRKRWASCAPDGTLRFNWRVIMAAPALIDYLVAHELAHLKVRGHSSDYWAVVAQAIPDYQRRRERLRELGPLATL